MTLSVKTYSDGKPIATSSYTFLMGVYKSESSIAENVETSAIVDCKLV